MRTPLFKARQHEFSVQLAHLIGQQSFQDVVYSSPPPPPPWTKWPPFLQQYFQMHFHEWNFRIFIKISLKLSLLSEPMLTDSLTHLCGTRKRWVNRADSRLVPSQWEMSLQSNGVSHWHGANLESALSRACVPVQSTHVISHILGAMDSRVRVKWDLLSHTFARNKSYCNIFWHWPLAYDALSNNTGTVKLVCNDHPMGYFSAFWNSSRWPRAT